MVSCVRRRTGTGIATTRGESWPTWSPSGSSPRAASRRKGDPIALGLPRGGVPVAAVIADRVGGELDVLCVRKVGTPGQRELALGAVASGGLTVLNDDLIYQLGLSEKAVRRSIEAAEEELVAQEARFRPDRPPLALGGRVVIVVDDGLATGATMRAAVRAVRTAEPARLIAAVPVGAPESCQVVEALTDDFVCPMRPPLFSAVGQWYRRLLGDLGRRRAPPARGASAAGLKRGAASRTSSPPAANATAPRRGQRPAAVAGARKRGGHGRRRRGRRRRGRQRGR